MRTSLSQHMLRSYVWDRRWMLLLIPTPWSCCRLWTGGFRQRNQVSSPLGPSREMESGSTEQKGITAFFCKKTAFQEWKCQAAQTSECCLMAKEWHGAIRQVELNYSLQLISSSEHCTFCIYHDTAAQMDAVFQQAIGSLCCHQLQRSNVISYGAAKLITCSDDCVSQIAQELPSMQLLI